MNIETYNYKGISMLNKNSNINHIGSKQMIIVNNFQKTKQTMLSFYNKNNKVFATKAFIGENGTTINKIEGDRKTPEGRFELGLTFGMHCKEFTGLNQNIAYIQINKNLYWVDDIYSKYYNQLVDIRKVRKDWNSAEHLIVYPTEYEYAIEIKTNPKNIAGKR